MFEVTDSPHEQPEQAKQMSRRSELDPVQEFQPPNSGGELQSTSHYRVVQLATWAQSSSTGHSSLAHMLGSSAESAQLQRLDSVVTKVQLRTSTS